MGERIPERVRLLYGNPNYGLGVTEMEIKPVCRFCGMPLPKGSPFGAVHGDCLDCVLANLDGVPGMEEKREELLDLDIATG